MTNNRYAKLAIGLLVGFHGIELLAAADLEQHTIRPIADKESSRLVLESDNDDTTLHQRVVETDVHADATSHLRGMMNEIDNNVSSGTERNESRKLAAEQNGRNNGLVQQLNQLKEESRSEDESLWNAISTISLTPGPMGPQGPKGDQGDPGTPGQHGFKGDPGPKGDKGDQGDPGKDGDKGDQGPAGKDGDKGDQGPPGKDGDKGDQGPPGKDGDKGDQGPPGKDGDKGDQGDPGKDGDKGDQGDPGADGPQGPQGDQGIQGPPGASPECTAASGQTQNAGGGRSHNNVQPFLAVNYIIALQGTFPSRSRMLGEEDQEDEDNQLSENQYRRRLSADPFLGEIIMFGGNFAPRGWALCDGQLLSISQYSALFSLLGTIYGGDGRTTFALPDLRGRAPIHAGRGPGLTPRSLGAEGGAESVTLTVNEIPAHSHSHVSRVTNTECSVFVYTGALEQFVVPSDKDDFDIILDITAIGAEGGTVDGHQFLAGLGAEVVVSIPVIPGDTFTILVGGKPSDGSNGGGGGSYVVADQTGNAIAVAGGGGGSGTAFDTEEKHGQAGTSGGAGVGNGPGESVGGTDRSGGSYSADSESYAASGGGFLGDGDPNSNGFGLGQAFWIDGEIGGVIGGAGGDSADSKGGFGGGGSGLPSIGAGGGGGGYSGGGGGGDGGVGGGGGSYLSGNGVITRSDRTGHGEIKICMRRCYQSNQRVVCPPSP